MAPNTQPEPTYLNAQAIAIALGGKARGNQIAAPAPGHSKHDRSLSILIDPSAPEGFMVNPHAGEDPIAMRDYVRAKAGLPDWTPSREERPAPTAHLSLVKSADAPKKYHDADLIGRGFRLAVEYDYVDLDGEVLFQVLRYEHDAKPKTFRQRQPDGAGEWLSGRPDPILYRWPEIAARPGEPVYVVEGEKDVDTLINAGLLATTPPNGSWPSDLSPLKGRTLFVIPDNDRAGADKADKAVGLLQGIATVKRVELPGLPEKGDVTDWLDAGNTVEHLQALAKAAMPFVANDNERGVLRFLGEDTDFVPEPELIRNTVPRNGVGFFGGQSGALKTFFAIHAATCLMTGEPLAGRDIERPGGVVYLAAEGEGTIKARLKARRMQMDEPDALLPFFTLEKFGSIEDQAGYAALEGRLRQAATSIKERFDLPLVALIIDTVAAAGMIPEDKENDPGAWQKVFHALQPISERLDIVIILIHHAGKNASAGLRGSSNARAAADFALMLACDRYEITGETQNHYLHLAKSREAPEGPIAAIQKRVVQIAERADGSPVTTLVLDFDTDGKAPAKKLKTSKTDRPFREAFEAAELHRVRVHGESSAPEVQAAKIDDVRAEFALRYVTAQSDPVKRADNARSAFKVAITRARDAGDYCFGTWSSTEWVWRIKTE